MSLAAIKMPPFQPNAMIRDGLNFKFGDNAKYDRFQDWNTINRTKKAMFGDASYQITADEITALKSEILHVLQWSAVSPETLVVKNIGKGLTKWEYHSWQKVLPPRRTLDFSRGANVATAKASSTLQLMGYDYDYHISMPQVDLYSSANRKVKFSETLEQGTFRELVNSLSMYREFSIFNGSDIPNLVDVNLKGLCNNASVTDPGALGLGSDDNLTAVGDILDAATVMSSELINAKFKPPFQLHLSPGVFSQALQNVDTTYWTSDFTRIADMGRKEGMQIFSEIVMNPFMIDSETETNSTGAMMAVKPGAENFEVIESYPLGYYPMPSQDLGLDGKILWCGGTAVYRPTAVVFANALTIDTLSA